MKIVQINSTCGVGSTGKICVQVSHLLNEKGVENYIFHFVSSDGNKNGIKFSSKSYVKMQALKSRISGNWGFNSQNVTKKIIDKLEEIKPDIVHLHNIHSHDCDLEMLFGYFKAVNQKLYWTFHDCWAFTGYCMYFTEFGCEKWKTECGDCPQRNKYSFFGDRSRELFNKKKELFSGLNLTIITPSKWMGDLVKQSFLKDYPVIVINNGINLEIFKPTKSSFRRQHNIPDSKKILLGVAFSWKKRKGLDVFIELSKMLDNEKYQIVLVGTDNSVDELLPDNIISVHRTKNQIELAQIYSAADLFVNPTREENFPTVNMEAIACGTPIVTFKTGGSTEVVTNLCGSVVDENTAEALYEQITNIFDKNLFNSDDCVKRAEAFASKIQVDEYYKLYKQSKPEVKSKKVVQINSTCGVGSTGKICASISEILDNEGIENYIFYSCNTNGRKNGIAFSSRSYIKSASLKSKLFGNWGFNSKAATRKMISKLKEIKPDIVHLHNIHSHDCDLKLLFKYFKSVNQKLYWTFHDCWAFTGYCMHFILAKCDNWKTECKNCPQYKKYSFFFDKSQKLFNQKKKLFEGLDITVITPSKWLADLVSQSPIFGNCPIKVINNGIDLSVFSPKENDFRKKHGIPENKKILLGVSFGWSNKKGLDVFIELSKRLDSEKYQIVMVGTNANTDKILPKNIISVWKTNNQAELAEIYSAADLFINPTREEVLGLTNLEALACGTPVVTFKTGGSPECIDENCGVAVDCDDIELLEKTIKRICEERPFKEKNCISYAKKFDKNDKFKEYTKLYGEA